VDENEFLQSLKTDEERFEDQVQSAEHFVRLKKQSGYGQSDEAEKVAVHPAIAAGIGGAAAGGALGYENGNLRRAGIGALVGGAGGAAAGALFGRREEGEEKKAGLGRGAFMGAKSAVREGVRSLGRDIKGVANTKAPNHTRAFNAGRIAAKAAPVVAAGAASYAVGKNEKTAGMSDKLKSIGPLAGLLMAGGAAAGGLGTYAASKPREHLGGKSRAEDELDGQVKAHQERPEEGLLHKMKNRTTELSRGYAQAFREHPGKASIIGAGAGAAGGLGLARLLDAVRKVPR
jgi:hypothetical protein